MFYLWVNVAIYDEQVFETVIIHIDKIMDMRYFRKSGSGTVIAKT